MTASLPTSVSRSSTMCSPNLFIIGAMKSGTTSLHNYLGEHPEIFMSPVKEPGHFVMDRSKEEEQEYLKLFSDAGNAKIVGESTVKYTMLPTFRGAAERISSFEPGAKLIYLMRDPVERCISHYWHQLRSKQRHGGANRDMVTAFQKDSIYLAYSNYSMQLRPFFDAFPAEQILTITLEELSADNNSVLKRIYEWLGVSSDFVAHSLNQRFHETPSIVTQKIRWLARFRRTETWEKIRPFIPAIVRRFGARVSEGQSMKREAVSLDRAHRFLRPICRETTKELELMLGRTFPEWKTLWKD